MPLTVAEFVIRWKTYDQSEEAGAKPHFLDLCDLLGQPHPAAADSAGENYAFEKRVSKTSGTEGFADVWFFERSLDPKRRSLIGAHYTSEEDIQTLIDPVLVRPLRQRWEEFKARIVEAREIERAEEAARSDKCVEQIFPIYAGRVKAESDLVVYWFEKARREAELNPILRVGLLATQSIRGPLVGSIIYSSIHLSSSDSEPLIRHLLGNSLGNRKIPPVQDSFGPGSHESVTS